MRRRFYTLKFYPTNANDRIRVLYFHGTRDGANRAAVRETYRLRRTGFFPSSVGIATKYGGRIRRTTFVALPRQRAAV